LARACTFRMNSFPRTPYIVGHLCPNCNLASSFIAAEGVRSVIEIFILRGQGRQRTTTVGDGTFPRVTPYEFPSNSVLSRHPVAGNSGSGM